MRYAVIFAFLMILPSVMAFEDTLTTKQKEQSYVPSYHGQKDRYSEDYLRNDPEVLVSTPNKPLSPAYFYHKPEPEVVYVVREPEEDIKVTYEWSEEP
jgi:hypothetical protein